MIFITYGLRFLEYDARELELKDKLIRQPPVDLWKTNIYVRDPFGKFIVHPQKINPNDYDLIMLMGRKDVGKDTTGNYISKITGWDTYALAKPLKDIMKIIGVEHDYLYDGDLKEEPMDEWFGYSARKLMQIFYTDLLTHHLSKKIPEIGENFFAIHFEKVRCKGISSPKLIFTDLRSPSYLSYLQKKYKTLIIKISRPAPIYKLDKHQSETGVDRFENYQYLIENNGTIDELYKKIDLIFETK